MNQPNIKSILQDKRLIDEFIDANKKLVIKVIQQTYPSVLNTYEKEDYIQEGLLSLYQAMLLYDENKHKKFSTFAYMVIKRKLINKVKSQRHKLYQYNKVISLNKEVESDDNETELIDLIESNENVEEECIENIREEEINYIIENQIKKRLKPKDMILFDYMLDGISQAEVARMMKCSRENIRQKFNRLRKLCSDVQVG